MRGLIKRNICNFKKIFLTLLSAIFFVFLFTCQNNGKSKAYRFYEHNKNNDALKIFSKSSIVPFRNLFRIDFNIYIEDYNTESIDNLKLQLQNKDGILYGYLEEHKTDKDSILNYIHKIYSNYKELDVLGIYGFGSRIEFIITPQDILLLLLNKDKFNEQEYIRKNDLKNTKLKYLDDDWIYYKLPENRKFSFH